MNALLHISILFILLLLYACGPAIDKVVSPEKQAIVKDSTYTISPDGEIPSGVPITVELRRDSTHTLKMEKVPMKGETKPGKLFHEGQPLGTPKVVRIPNNLPTITPGKNGVPLPKKLNVEKEVVLAGQPKPTPALPPQMKDNAIADIRFLDVEHGLGYSYVNDTYEDSRGQIWFATRGGISRYDGRNFFNYTSQEGLGARIFWRIFEDSKGNLWFAGNGVFGKYDGTFFTNYVVREEEGFFNFRAIIEDQFGYIWIGSNRGLMCFSPADNEGKFYHFNEVQGLVGHNIFAIQEDQKGNIWIGADGGVSRFTPEKDEINGAITIYTKKEGLAGENIRSLLADKSGNIWIGSNDGGISVYKENNGEEIFTHYTTEMRLLGNDISSLEEDKQGNIWIGDPVRGVFLLDLQNQTITHFSKDQGLSSNEVIDIYEDKKGNIWIGTFGGGVIRYNPYGFKHFTSEMGLSGNIIYTSLFDHQNNLWIGTDNFGLSVFSPKNGGETSHYSFENGFSSDVRNIIEDSKGNVWIAGFGSGNKFRPNNIFRYSALAENIEVFRYTSKVPYYAIIFEGLNNELWIWERSSAGFFQFIPENDAFIHYSILGVDPFAYATKPLQDRKGSFWVVGNGLYKLDVQSSLNSTVLPIKSELKITHYTAKEGLGNNISDLLEDSQGHLWAATRGGLNRYVPSESGIGSFVTYGVEHGLTDNHIRGLVEDHQQNIWVSTIRGLNLLVPFSVDSLEDKVAKKDTFSVINFTQQDGLREIAFLESSLSIDWKNRLWCGTTDGLSMLDLNHFEIPKEAPQNLQLTHIDINQTFIDYRKLIDANNKPLSFGAELKQGIDSIAAFQNYPVKMRLPYDLNHLTFHFSAIDWVAPHKIQYRYRIDGIDRNWRQPTSETQADYSNLPHGTFTLRVQARGVAQTWSDELTYTFTILPPWWYSWWAYSLYGLCILGGIYLIFRWRTRTLRRQQQLLRTRVQEQTQEIRTEQARAEDLLLNILPASVAQELKEKGKAAPKYFEEVSIMFADFKGFTNIVASIPGRQLVNELDEIFQKYDDIVAEVGLEKIQTIGDAYLAACGLPTPDPDHAKKCVIAGRRIIQYLEERNKTSSVKWQVRLGIHSGPITAGVIGKKKFAYDLFGDTINIAARIESAGEAGRINISAATHYLIKDEITCEYRGKINAKGKGELDMYFVGI